MSDVLLRSSSLHAIRSSDRTRVRSLTTFLPDNLANTVQLRIVYLRLSKKLQSRTTAIHLYSKGEMLISWLCARTFSWNAAGCPVCLAAILYPCHPYLSPPIWDVCASCSSPLTVKLTTSAAVMDLLSTASCHIIHSVVKSCKVWV